MAPIPQKQKGLVRLLFNLPAGELDSKQLRALAEISKKYGSGYISMTLRQNFELPNIPSEQVTEVIAEMANAGFHLRDSEQFPNVVACPGGDQCGLALMKTLGLAAEIDRHLAPQTKNLPKGLSINLSGCSNGCTHPMINDIGFVGAGGKIGGRKVFGFDVHLGGSHDEGKIGERIGFVPDGRVIPFLNRLLAIYRSKAKKGETFVDFLKDKEITQIISQIEEEKELLYPSITKERD